MAKQKQNRFFRWINNTRGRPDAMLTLAIVGFAVAIFRFFLGGVNFSYSGHTVNVAPSDGGSIAALLGPTLGAYVARRHSETKYGADNYAPPDQPEAVAEPVDDGSGMPERRDSSQGQA